MEIKTFRDLCFMEEGSFDIDHKKWIAVDDVIINLEILLPVVGDADLIDFIKELKEARG